MKENKALVVTTVWIVVVSVFLFEILQDSFMKEGAPKYIKNNEQGVVIKSESKRRVKYKVEDGNGKYLYSWTFTKDNNDLEKTENIENKIDFDIETDVVNPKIEKITDTTDKMVVSFAHHGSLPSASEIELNVSDVYNDGDKLYLYYFNEDENVIEFINNNIVVNNGLADFKIEHCSEYILSKDIIEESVNNPTGGAKTLFYIMVSVIIIFALKAILFKGK